MNGLFLFRLLWAKGLSANAIQSEMRPVYSDKYFTRLVIHVWCKKFVHGRESVVDEEEPDPVLFRWLMQWSQRSIPSCQTGVWWDRCLHEFGRHVEKWNINVWRLNTFACWTCSLFSFNLQCCATLASCKENCWAKYCTDWLRSKYKWRHSNDVIVIKIPVYVPIKFLSKLIFPNFHILKLYRMI